MAQSRSWFRRVLRWIGILALAFVVLSVASVLIMRWLPPLTSAFILRDRASNLFDASYRYEHQWVSWAKISAPMKASVIAAEDQKFPDHWGFDFDSMEKAWSNNQRGKKIHGASTLTQQTAKNLYLWPGRSLVRKGIEAYFTVLMETFWPKRRILEIYLNIAEFGKGVFGVEAAAHHYFHKSAAQLSPQEAALLAAVLPAPKRLLVDKPSAYVRIRQAWIITQMWQLGGPARLAQL